MKNEPNQIRDKARRRASKTERPPPLPDPAEADDATHKRLHLLERRGHRWERRNSHA
ncbi:hypothetical protein [Hyphomonas sp.]|uniref:hypothetical protein n=1 Tax=Hyphomonas sp. TaxID=87 RepID=UPI0035285DF0